MSDATTEDTAIVNTTHDTSEDTPAVPPPPPLPSGEEMLRLATEARTATIMECRRAVHCLVVPASWRAAFLRVDGVQAWLERDGNGETLFCGAQLAYSDHIDRPIALTAAQLHDLSNDD